MSSILKVDSITDVNGNAIISSDGSGNLTPNTFTGLTISGNLSVDGGTIKLDGNYPTGTNNNALGDNTFNSLTSGITNTTIGSYSSNSLTSGSENVAMGASALRNNSTGSYNVAVGRSALLNNTASNNTAVGYQALLANTSGFWLAALGTQALESNTTGDSLSAVGFRSLWNNTEGYQNSALGTQSLQANTTGIANTAVGGGALQSNTTASNNTAVGYQAGLNTTNQRNAFFGSEAGKNNTTGESNTYIGRQSGQLMTTGVNNTIIGRYDGNQGGLDIRTSSNNIVLSDGDGNPRFYTRSNGRSVITNNYSEVIIGGQHTIHENSTGQHAVIFQHSSSGTPYGFKVHFNQASPDNNTSYFFEGQDSTTARIRIYSDGDLVNHDNSYGSISDEKLKEQITDASSQWNDIKDLRIRKFKFKSDVSEKGDSDELWRLGLVAQEAELVSPNLIKESPDTDDNNQDLGTTTKSIKYSILYMKAVKALQEAMQKIEDLEARVNTLEGN